MKKASETHKLSPDELKSEESRLRRELYDLRSQAVTQKLENPRQLRNLRRDIARVLTERKLRSGKESA
jgi:large subunit ribosomal protein L29